MFLRQYGYEFQRIIINNDTITDSYKNYTNLLLPINTFEDVYNLCSKQTTINSSPNTLTYLNVINFSPITYLVLEEYEVLIQFNTEQFLNDDLTVSNYKFIGIIGDEYFDDEILWKEKIKTFFI